MRARIGRYRRAPIGVGEDPVIGCLFVRDVRFFLAGAVADPPPQFARNIVQGKSYDMADPAVTGYFADILQLTLGAAVELDVSRPWHRSGPVFGDPDPGANTLDRYQTGLIAECSDAFMYD